MDLRIAAVLLLAVTGCAGRLERTLHDEAPPHRSGTVAQAASSAPARPRPAAAILQAASEMRENPDLHVLLVGPDAHPARKAILREGHGKIHTARVRVAASGPHPAAAARPRVAFYFYVPDGRPLEERFPQLDLAGADQSGVK